MAETYPVILINPDIPIYFRFTQNPNSITFNSRKVFQETRTIGGYVYDHWGKTPTTITVQGRVRKALIPGQGELLNQDPILNTELFALRQMYEVDKRRITSIIGMLGNNSAVKKLLGDKTPVQQNLGLQLSRTLLYYKWNIYSGFFTAFSFNESGMNPFHNEYSFEFLATGSVEDFLRDTLIKVANNNATARVTSAITLNAQNLLK